jgi:hypothetical protein
MIQVIDASGRKLFEYPLQHGKQNIPFPHSPGFYMLILRSNANIASVKLLAR